MSSSPPAIYQQHEANSFRTLIHSTLPTETLHGFGIHIEPYAYLGEDAGRKFLLHITSLAQKVSILYLRNMPVSGMTKVYFHNLSSYDQAFIISNLSVLDSARVQAIPYNSEKFISFSILIDGIFLSTRTVLCPTVYLI